MTFQSWTNMRRLLRGTLLGTCLTLLGAASTASPVFPPQAGAGEVIMIKLQGGLFQWGVIEDHSAEKLSFRRMDTGGLVVVPWTLIEPVQELDLRTQFGYVDLSSNEIMTAAEKLVLRDGREVIGLLTGREGDFLLFQSQGRVLRIPKSYVKNHVAGLLVPALDVLSKDELYLEQVASLDPTDAISQFELAVFCERILDFSRALEHYTKVTELDPIYKAKEIGITMARVTLKVANQVQVDFLDNLDREGRRDHFLEAFQGLLQFDALYPKSPLAADRIKLEARLVKARDAYMTVSVAERWFSWMVRLAGKAAREKSFEGALEYLEGSMSEEIVQQVTASLASKWPTLEETQVRKFFLERKPGRWKPASYGLGTWLLGEEKALKDDSGAEPEKKPVSDSDQERRDKAKQIENWLRNQELAKRARRSTEDDSEVSAAWDLMRISEKRTWMVAYYAENGGDLVVRNKPELQNCSECAGLGVKYEIITGFVRDDSAGGKGSRPCPTCHSVGRVRRIRYR
jgi:tetratricopeptide (TPR) repeat protein